MTQHRVSRIGTTFFAPFLAAAGCFVAAGCLLNAQSTSTPPTGASGFVNTSNLETEVVTITDAAAFPSTITRKQGPFYLLLVNKTRQNVAKISFASPTAQAAQIPVLAQALNLPFLPTTRRLSGLFNPPPGVYQLKWQTSGDVLLTINIEQ
jgi:hypothetical protein